jgi:hypothetical protein
MGVGWGFAGLVERLICNQDVTSSNLVAGTISSLSLCAFAPRLTRDGARPTFVLISFALCHRIGSP